MLADASENVFELFFPKTNWLIFFFEKFSRFFGRLAHPGMLSETAQVARGRLRCLGPGEILRGRLRFS